MWTQAFLYRIPIHLEGAKITHVSVVVFDAWPSWMRLCVSHTGSENDVSDRLQNLRLHPSQETAMMSVDCDSTLSCFKMQKTHHWEFHDNTKSNWWESNFVRIWPNGLARKWVEFVKFSSATHAVRLRLLLSLKRLGRSAQILNRSDWPVVVCMTFNPHGNARLAKTTDSWNKNHAGWGLLLVNSYIWFSAGLLDPDSLHSWNHTGPVLTWGSRTLPCRESCSDLSSDDIQPYVCLEV